MKSEIYKEEGYPVGYLVNFGHKEKLEWERMILSEFVPLPSSASISVN